MVVSHIVVIHIVVLGREGTGVEDIKHNLSDIKNLVPPYRRAPKFPSTFPSRMRLDIPLDVQVEHITETANTDNITGFTLNINNVNDPMGTSAVSVQSALVDLWKPMYGAYQLLWTTVKFNLRMSKFMQPQTTVALNNVTTFAQSHQLAGDASNVTGWLVCIILETATLLTDYDQIIHHPLGKRWYFPSLNSHKSCRGSFMVSPKQFFKSGYSLTHDTEGIDERWKDSTPWESNPTHPLFVHVYLLDQNALDNSTEHLGFNGNFRITQSVMCMEPITDYSHNAAT